MKSTIPIDRRVVELRLIVRALRDARDAIEPLVSRGGTPHAFAKAAETYDGIHDATAIAVGKLRDILDQGSL